MVIGLQLLSPLLVISAALAAEPPTVRLDTTELVVGERTTLELTITDGEPTQVPQPTAPANLELAFAGQSRNTTVFNGSVERSIQLRYQLVATVPGEYTLPPIIVEYTDGTKRLTEPLAISVKPMPDREATEDPFTLKTYWSDGNGNPISQAFQDQVVLLQTEFISQKAFESGSWQNFPEQNLTPLNLDDKDKSQYKQEIGGVEATVREQSFAYLLTETGTHTWSSPQLVLNVLVQQKRQRRGLFGFYQRTEPRTIFSPPLELEVKPLPNPPPDFSGLIGDVRARIKLSTRKPGVGDSITWTLIVEGDGDFEGITLPGPEDTPGLQTYEGTSKSQIQLTGKTLSGQLRVTKTLVPTTAGELTLPPYTLNYFSPSTGKFETLTLKARTLNVQPGEMREVELTSFGEEPADVEESPEGLPAAYTYEPVRGEKWPWLTWMPVFLLLGATPGVTVAGAAGASRARQWFADRKIQHQEGKADRPTLDQLPAEPSARLAQMTLVLRQALALRLECSPQEATSELYRLDGPLGARAREIYQSLQNAQFAGKSPPATLEADLRQLLADLEAP